MDRRSLLKATCAVPLLGLTGGMDTFDPMIKFKVVLRNWLYVKASYFSEITDIVGWTEQLGPYDRLTRPDRNPVLVTHRWSGRPMSSWADTDCFVKANRAKMEEYRKLLTLEDRSIYDNHGGVNGVEVGGYDFMLRTVNYSGGC